jgi:PKD repeat protein
MINIVAGATSGNISVSVENACGVSTEQTRLINITPLPETPVFDQAPTEICEGVATDISVNQMGSNSFIWILPNGWTGSSNTNIISVTPDSNSGYVQVSSVNSCGEGLKDSIFININTVPSEPIFINPAPEVCDASDKTFTVVNVSGNSYFWTIPVGWTGSSSTNSINVTNDGTAGSISVYAENACGIGASSSININIISDVAEQPSIISGPNPVCANSSVTYSVEDVLGITYYWNFPSGWSGTGHESTIDVTTNSLGGTITLVPFNACGMGISRTLNVSVNEAVGPISSISGNIEVCENSVQTYSATAVNASEYIWTLPSTWSGSSSFNSISSTVGNTSGYIRVYPQNACGQGLDTLLWVDVNLLPISNFSFVKNQSEVTFTNLSENADSYLWDFGDTQTSTDVNPIHDYASSDNYHVVLTATNQCSQDAFYSNIHITTINLDEFEGLNISLYPNPSSGLVTVNGLDKKDTEIQIIDITGRTIINMKNILAKESVIIDLSEYSEGTYQVFIKQESVILKKLIVLQK